LAHVLARLGSTDAWVVHGSDGLDEITTTGPTHVAQLRQGVVTKFDISPTDVGLPVADPADLKGGDPTENAAALTAVLEGQTGAYRDVVLMNAGATLVVAGKAPDLTAGVALAATMIDTGAARAKLSDLVAITHRAAP
jgi:anthranilate phosphoribosyltransferase